MHTNSCQYLFTSFCLLRVLSMGDSEGGGGLPSVSNAMLIALFKPSPSIDIVKFWQGIVEIVLRGACLVLTFILFICACTAVSNVSPFLNPLIAGNLGRDTSAAGGWLVFVTLITLIIEGLLLAGRFLVFGFAVTYATIVHIVDICVSAVIAVAIFCGAVAIAVYSGNWNSINSSGVFTGVVSATGASAAFGFFTIFAFVGLAVWMILSLVMKWRNVSKYSSPSSTSAEDE